MGVCVVQDRVGMGVRVHAGACLWVFARAHAFDYGARFGRGACVCVWPALAHFECFYPPLPRREQHIAAAQILFSQAEARAARPTLRG